MAGGDFSGYFLQGLGEGLQSGMNMGQQLQEMRWQKKQRKELEEKQAKMLEVSNLWNAKIKEAGADNIYSDEEISQISTIYLSGGYEFMEHYQGAMDAIKSMNKAKYDQEKEWMDLFANGIEGLSPGDIQEAYDYIKPKITSEKGLNMLEAYSNMQKRKAEAVQAQPTAEVFGSAGATREAYPEAGYEYSATAKGYVPTFQKPTTPEAPPTELDIMGETQKKLDYAYNTGNANYFNQIAKSLGVDTTFDTYKQKPGVAGAAKTKAVDPNDVLFGTNGIMKDYINTGGTLGEEQKAEIRNNYNLIKPSLSADVRTQVEDYLKQIGIDVNAPIAEPISEPEPTTSKPSFLGNIWKKITTPGGTPAYKGTPQQKDYTAMSDDELADLALFGDTSAIEELKRRGLI